MLIFGGNSRIQKKHLILNAIGLLTIYYFVLKPSWTKKNTDNGCFLPEQNIIVHSHEGVDVDLDEDEITYITINPDSERKYYSEGYDKSLEYVLKALLFVFLVSTLAMITYLL